MALKRAAASRRAHERSDFEGGYRAFAAGALLLPRCGRLLPHGGGQG